MFHCTSCNNAILKEIYQIHQNFFTAKTIHYIWYQELIMCRGEYLTLYSPVICDCAEVKRLPFRVM